MESRQNLLPSPLLPVRPAAPARPAGKFYASLANREFQDYFIAAVIAFGREASAWGAGYGRCESYSQIVCALVTLLPHAQITHSSMTLRVSHRRTVFLELLLIVLARCFSFPI